ncbi:Tetratricopeptide TPR_2 repeat protein [Fulvivirga imtechensis AK7]|uniref:Tetratricopeptide TPR_2 repeat protein n=2 Tax=Fulvivirga TaxID=396811 RepID=L8JLL0_9BACT|nr:Tetratricopeptide TPR_2 repeat protein [Fulvivirga imtechensis AK7]
MLLNAEAILAHGDTTAAIAQFRQTLTRYPQSFAATMRLAEVHYHIEDYNTAIQYCNIAIDITENFIGKSMEKLQADSTPTPEEIAEEKQKIQRYETDKIGIYHLKGRVRLKQLRRDDAIEEFKNALEIKQNSEVLTDLALTYLEIGLLQDALVLLHQAKFIDSVSYKPYFNLGNVHYKIQNTDSALYYYTITQKKAPNLKWPYLYSGMILTEKKQYYEALDQYSAFIDIDSTNEELYFRRAVLNSEINRWDAALEDWDHVLALNPENAEAWRNKGLSFFRIEAYDSAITAFNKALDIAPNEPFTYINRGYSYYLSNEPEKALQDLNYGLKHLPKYYLGYYFRALTYMQLRKKNKACDDLSKALGLGMKEEEVDEKLMRRCF